MQIVLGQVGGELRPLGQGRQFLPGQPVDLLVEEDAEILHVAVALGGRELGPCGVVVADVEVTDFGPDLDMGGLVVPDTDQVAAVLREFHCHSFQAAITLWVNRVR